MMKYRQLMVLVGLPFLSGRVVSGRLPCFGGTHIMRIRAAPMRFSGFLSRRMCEGTTDRGSVHCSTLVREASLARDGNYHRDPQWGNGQRVREFGALSPNRDIFIRSLPARPQKSWLKDHEGQRWWMAPKKQCDLDTVGLMHIRAQPVTVCTPPAQTQARQKPA